MLGTVTLYNILDELGIDYTEVTHPAVTTMEAAQFVKTLIDGTPIKNLFLTNRKGNYYLVLMSEDRRADLKALAQIIGTGRLSFANADELRRVLNLEPGSVTPLALINDADQQVEVLVDTALAGQRLLMHPNTNTQTVSLEYEDLLGFIGHTGHDYRFISAAQFFGVVR